MHAISRFGYISGLINCIAQSREIEGVLVMEELAVPLHCNAFPHIGGQQEHSHQPVFLTILTGGKPELFSRLLNWRSHQGWRPQAEAAQVLLSSR